MESNLGPNIIDFYGLPGSGKSTTSHNVALKYKNNGKKVVEPSYDLDHEKHKISRKIYKLSILLRTFFFSHKTYLFFKHLAKKNGYTIKNGQINQISNICLKIHFLKKYNKRKLDYIIFDEGIAQAAISLSINSKIAPSQNLKDILLGIKQKIKIQYIYIPCEVNTALERVASRNSKDTRIEKQRTRAAQFLLMNRYNELVSEIRGSVA